MKVASWVHDGRQCSGFIVDGHAISVPNSTGLDIVRLGLQDALALGQQVAGSSGVPCKDVTLIPPLSPPSVRDFVAFEEHVEGVVKSVSGEGVIAPEWYEAPTFYFTNPHTLRGSGEVIRPPSGTNALDFELEVAAVLGPVAGSDGRDLDPAASASHIFGYTILNDWSARDLQRREMKVNLGPAKGKDFASTLGPWIVTADEFVEKHDSEGFLQLHLSVSINGEPFGTDLLSNMGWPFRELVAYAARDSVVVPGDVLGSGTCGSGCLAEAWGRAGRMIPRPLIEGDVVRMEVEGIGAIENTIGSARDLPPVRQARIRSRIDRA